MRLNKNGESGVKIDERKWLINPRQGTQTVMFGRVG
jgi:hypothetical protein